MSRNSRRRLFAFILKRDDSSVVLLERYGIPTEHVKVYFRRDYTSLHNDEYQMEKWVYIDKSDTVI